MKMHIPDYKNKSIKENNLFNLLFKRQRYDTYIYLMT